MDGSIQQENFNNSRFVTTDTEKNKSKSQKIIIILLLLIVILLLAIILYYIYFSFKRNLQKLLQRKLVLTLTNLKVLFQIKLFQIHIMSYQNSTFGYSFKYPSSWELYTSNYPNNVGGDINANSPTGGEVELVNNNGANIILAYNITGIGGSIQLISKIEKININNTQYGLVFLASYSKSSCPQMDVTPPYTISSSLLPQSCTQYTNRVYLINNLSKNIENIHGNPFLGEIFLNTHIPDPTINSNSTNALGSLSLSLPSAININSINTNSDVKVFENFSKSLQLL